MGGYNTGLQIGSGSFGDEDDVAYQASNTTAWKPAPGVFYPNTTTTSVTPNVMSAHHQLALHKLLYGAQPTVGQQLWEKLSGSIIAPKEVKDYVGQIFLKIRDR